MREDSAYMEIHSVFCSSLCSMLSCFSRIRLCDSMGCSPPGSSVHGDSPGKNTGVGCHALLQGIFLTQRWNLRLLHLTCVGWWVFFLPLVPPGKPCSSSSCLNKKSTTYEQCLASYPVATSVM